MRKQRDGAEKKVSFCQSGSTYHFGTTALIRENIINHNNKMVSCLKSSLEKRLSHYLLDDSYIMQAILDPSLKLRWCKNPEEIEEKLL